MKQRKKSACLFALLLALSSAFLFSCDSFYLYRSSDVTEAVTVAQTDVQTDAPATSAAPDDTEPQTEPVTTDEPPIDDILALTVCPDPYSDEYRSLGEDIGQIETGFTGNVKKLRFRVEAEGVRVTLERVEYIALFDFYRASEQIMSFDAEQGKAYELAAPAAGKTPEYRIVAEIDGCRAEYLIKRDAESKSVELVCGEWKPGALTLVSPEMAIARSAAIAHARYGDISGDTACAEIIASAIAQRRSYEYTAGTEYFETDEWLILAYLRAAAPSRDALPPQGELIIYPAEDGGAYRTAPVYYSGKAAASVFDIEENADGTVTVRYDVIVYSEDAPPALSGRAVTLTPVHDTGSPFEYAVTEVRQTEVAY